MIFGTVLARRTVPFSLIDIMNKENGSLHTYEIIAVAVILLIALIVERNKYVINPIIWILGGAIGIAIKYIYDTKISLLEGFATLAITFVIILIVASRFGGAVGGGILKGILMCSFYLGRGTVVFIPLLFLMLFLVLKWKRESISGAIFGMPFLLYSYVATVLIMELVV